MMKNPSNEWMKQGAQRSVADTLVNQCWREINFIGYHVDDKYRFYRLIVLFKETIDGYLNREHRHCHGD
ncbi:hypothetical protein [Castellaniella sp. MT123]|uniref:hypothetical protein n=1 Tax=Castellaniella sp. MT123 TaxID=3140381 RepID=UPI0031F46356